MSAREMPAGRALDAEVAEKVMGRRVECGVNCRMDAHGDRLDVDIGFADSLRIVWTSETYEPVPHYSTDIAAAWEMEAAIPAGRRTAYLNALKEMVGRRDDLVLHYSLWALIRATPEQRCRAALAAMEHAPLAAVERAP